MGKLTQFHDLFINPYRVLNRSLDIYNVNPIRPVIVSLITLLILQYTVYADSPFLVGSYKTIREQESRFLIGSPTRHKIDLAGTWQVSVNGDTPQPVLVPSAYDGVGELVYHRTFEITPEEYENSSFSFISYGINYYSEISINGTIIGVHSGGYTSFSFPIPKEILTVGENSIRVSVNNYLRTRDTLPIKAQLWTPRNYGGIFRDIYLFVTPNTAILEHEIRTTFLDGYSVAEMHIDMVIGRQEITVDDLRTDLPDTNVYHVSVEVIDPIRGITIAQSQPKEIFFGNIRNISESIRLIARNPRMWSPDQPDLYTVSIIMYRNGTEYDQKNIIYGFRDITIRDGSIYLNGHVFRARGIMYHEYHPASGSAVSYEDLERDVALLKIANVNLVRVAFHPPHPYLLNLFDRYGMMCMIEIPAVNIPGAVLKNDVFRATARAYLDEMIERNRHHPSVLAWGLGDNLEMPHSGAVLYVREMSEYARFVDERPVYVGSQFPSNDIATEYLDLAVLNIPPGLINGVAESIEVWKNRYPEKPLIIGKFGYYIEPGNTGGYSDPNSYESQARYLLQMMQLLRSRNVDGIIVNSFIDWRSQRPTMLVHTRDLTLHTIGLVSADRRPRKGFEVVRALYRGEKIPPLAVGELPGTTPFEYIVGGFIVLIGFAYMLNSSRRFRENVNRSLLRPYNFYADVRDQRILSGFHTIYLGLLISLTMAMIFASFLQHYSNNQILDYVFTHFLITDGAKAIFADTVGETWQLILILTVLYFVLLLFVTLVVQICSLFVKTKVMLTHSFVITFWSSLPLVIFIPLSMILYNVLETEFYVIPVLTLIGVLLLWVFFRLLKGISVIYDMRAFRIYVLGIFILISVNGIMLLISEYMQATFSYTTFFIHMFEGFRF
jgi:hypothetical protein